MPQNQYEGKNYEGAQKLMRMLSRLQRPRCRGAGKKTVAIEATAALTDLENLGRTSKLMPK